MFPEKRCLKMRQGTGPQYVSWGYIFRERRLKIRAPESFVSCFLALVFLGYFTTPPTPSFSIEPSPWPSNGNTIVKESIGHVTMKGVHPQQIMSA